MTKSKKPRFSRILLKLSGEALGGESGVGISAEAVQSMAEQIREVRELGVQVVVVVGGRASSATMSAFDPTTRRGRSRRSGW